jgi:hypothetical protein
MGVRKRGKAVSKLAAPTGESSGAAALFAGA